MSQIPWQNILHGCFPKLSHCSQVCRVGFPGGPLIPDLASCLPSGNPAVGTRGPVIISLKSSFSYHLHQLVRLGLDHCTWDSDIGGLRAQLPQPQMQHMRQLCILAVHHFHPVNILSRIDLFQNSQLIFSPVRESLPGDFVPPTGFRRFQFLPLQLHQYLVLEFDGVSCPFAIFLLGVVCEFQFF